MLISLAQFCTRRRRAVIGGWIALLVVFGGILGVAGTAFSNSDRLPASDSATAYALLAKAESNAASATPGIIVWHSPNEAAISSSAHSKIIPMLDKVAHVPGVMKVISPLQRLVPTRSAGMDTPLTQPSTLVRPSTPAEAETLAKGANSAQLSVETGDTAFTKVGGAGASDVVGVLAALLILVLVFRSVWAALLPIITGVAGVGISSLVVLLLSHVVTIPSVAPELSSALIGLGVGIDYALLVVNRHRKALRAGADVPTAISSAMNTSGRAVLFAGGTVVIALLGMLVLNAEFLSGMAIAASVTVAITVIGAVTLLPALLATLGRKVLRKSERSTTLQSWRPREQQIGCVARWRIVRPVGARHATSPGRHWWTCTFPLVALTIPFLSMRLGSADASSDPTGTRLSWIRVVIGSECRLAAVKGAESHRSSSNLDR